MSAPYTLHGPLPTLDRAVLVMHFTGWMDAGGAAAAAIAAVDQTCATAPLATFDSDLFIDYRARRPVMELRDGVNTRIAWSEIELRHGTSPDGRDVLVFSGPEPDSRWKEFSASAADLARQLGVHRAVGFGAYPYAAPHTRTPLVACTSPTTELIVGTSYEKGSVDVAAGVGAVLEHSLAAVGIPALGLWARVPHYVTTMSFPAAAVELLRGLQRATGIAVPTDELEREAVTQRRHIDQLVDGNDEHRTMVEQLETLYDRATEQADRLDANGLPSGDDLAAEFERFLRDQDG